MYDKLIFNKRFGEKYKLYFVDSYGLYLIIESYSKERLTKMYRVLKKVNRNLILK